MSDIWTTKTGRGTMAIGVECDCREGWKGRNCKELHNPKSYRPLTELEVEEWEKGCGIQKALKTCIDGFMLYEGQPCKLIPA